MKFSKKELWILIVIIVIIFVGYFGTKWYVDNRYDYYIVDGESMAPNLLNGAEVKVDKNKKIERYDIVVMEVGKSTIIKRVIGLPNDTLKFTKDDKLFINEKEITYPFEIKGSTRKIDEEIKLDYQFYYVLGDNRDNAYDSRSFGKVSKSQILGVVVDINNPETGNK